MNWRIIAAKHVRKQLRRIPLSDSRRIEIAIEDLRVNPFSGDVIKLGGEENILRKRIGSYRIVYKILSPERIIYIQNILRRTSSTY